MSAYDVPAQSNERLVGPMAAEAVKHSSKQAHVQIECWREAVSLKLEAGGSIIEIICAWRRLLRFAAVTRQTQFALEGR